MKTTSDTASSRNLIVFGLVVGISSFFVSNLFDNFFVSKACNPITIITVSCGVLGIAGSTPIGLLGSIVSTVLFLVLALALRRHGPTGNSKFGSPSRKTR